MSHDGITELPDQVYGAADVNKGGRRLSTSASGGLLHAHFGGLYVAMSERNWRTLFAALSELEVEVTNRSYRIVFDDDNREAHAVNLGAEANA